MSSSVNSKFRYRVIVGLDKTYPYTAQRKGWIFWHKVDTARSVDEAKEIILKDIKHRNRNPGSVIAEYTEQDYLADKLKGTA